MDDEGGGDGFMDGGCCCCCALILGFDHAEATGSVLRAEDADVDSNADDAVDNGAEETAMGCCGRSLAAAVETRGALAAVEA